MNESFLNKLNIPRVLKGQSGNYWQVAANGDKSREFFVRLKFERLPYANAEGKVALVEGLQVNVVYLGDEFLLPEPFAPLDVRPYADGDKTVKGVLLAKIWIPMGEFHKNLIAMYDYAKSTVSPVLQDKLAGLFGSADTSATLPLTDIFEFLKNDIEAVEPMVLKPQLYINQEWIINVSTIQKKNSDAMTAMKATAQETNAFEKWEKSFAEKNKPQSPPETSDPINPEPEPEF